MISNHPASQEASITRGRMGRTQQKARCFISYSHEDMDRESLDYFCHLLNEHSNGGYDILIDQDIGFGESITDFMELLHQVDSVILMLTPSYKRKVLERRGGVNHEFTRIILRHGEHRRLQNQGKKSSEIEGYFSVIPVLFSGTAETSIPNELNHLKYADLVGLRALRDSRGNFQVSEHAVKSYIPTIRNIASSLCVTNTLKHKVLPELHQNYFNRLFLDLKADWRNPRHRDHDYFSTLFVKTFAYRKVKNQAAWFIIGRKGSGKTTITDAMAHEGADRYIGHISIIADEFNLETPYQLLFNSPQTKSDMRHVFLKLKCFRFAWQAFLYLCCMELLGKAAAEGRLSGYQAGLLPPIRALLARIYDGHHDPGESNDKQVLFLYCFSQLSVFINNCIGQARPTEEYFFSDLQARFQLHHFLAFIFGDETLSSLKSIVQSLDKKFLITLDGFDSAFDVFRRDSILHKENLDQKSSFEVDWLRAFMRLVLEIKRDGNSLFHQHADFCVTVPQDRFFEVLATERDSYQYLNRYCPLKWSGIELAILLRKRLEELTQTSTDREKSAEARLSQLLRQHYKHIPTDITFTFNNRQYTMPLFMYVLRHTFWRPRDILLYYAKIISVSELLKKRKHRIDTSSLRQIIKDVTRDIVNSEFMNEFETTVLNIREIVGAFARRKQVLSSEEVGQLLESVDFRLATGMQDCRKVADKIRFLYQIGFLGVLANEDMCNRLNLKMAHAFDFNEGEAPIQRIVADGFKGYNFIIHPIFCEYLELDTSGNELILQFDWDYLHNVEDHLFA